MSGREHNQLGVFVHEILEGKFEIVYAEDIQE